jgi:hypothetical protein
MKFCPFCADRFFQAEKNLNIVKFISLLDETKMAVEKKDNFKTYEVLSNLVGYLKRNMKVVIITSLIL